MHYPDSTAIYYICILILSRGRMCHPVMLSMYSFPTCIYFYLLFLVAYLQSRFLISNEMIRVAVVYFIVWRIHRTRRKLTLRCSLVVLHKH